MVDAGIEQSAAYNLMRQFDKSGTKAGKLVSIASFDNDKDGTPDLSPQQMKVIADIMDIKLQKGKSVAQQAKAEAKAYLDEKLKDKEATQAEKEAAKQLYESWKKLMNGK
jgi:hypothetical protein